MHTTGHPDADLDVLIYLADGSSTLGAWLGEHWVDAQGERVDAVRGWSPLPELEAASTELCHMAAVEAPPTPKPMTFIFSSGEANPLKDAAPGRRFLVPRDLITNTTPCRCGTEGCADSSCPGRRTLSPADALDAMRHQLDLMADFGLHLGRTDDDLIVILRQEIEAWRHGLHHLRDNNVALRTDRDRLAAEVEALRADAERLDSGCILTQERDEFGEPYQRITTGIDLRAAIDAAKAKGAA